MRDANITKSGKKIELKWEGFHKESFENLKQALTSAPVLAFPNRNDTFILDTDASHFAMGAVLSQIQNNEEKVICYGSKKFSKAERMYCITRKELMAVYVFVKKYKHYLLGKKFIIRTDHKSLTWMLNWKKPNTSQYCSWIDELGMYDFKIYHRKGQLHTNADALSRELQCEQCEIKHVNPKVKRNVKVSKSKRSESDEEDYRHINELKEIKEEYNENKINEILKFFHDRLGHSDTSQTLIHVKKYHDWPLMDEDIKKYVANCMPCAERKQGNKMGYKLKNSFTATEPFEIICCDVTGPLPNSEGYLYIHY